MVSLSSRVRSMTASAMGNIIRVVAVLEIHMLSSADAAMKPKTNRRLLPSPKSRTIDSAIRRCVPDLASAVERIKPPSKSRMTGFPYACETAAWSRTPDNGKAIIGMNDVAAKGMGSRIHQHTTKVVIPSTMAISLVAPCDRQRKYAAKAASGPAKRAMALTFIGF